MSLSLWEDQLPAVARRPALDSDVDADFCVIGGGYTGLWTAYWLKRLEPSANVVVLEREHVGFGASGRNGGWFSALFPASMDKVAKLSSRDSAIAMQRAMNANVAEVGALLQEEGIDCDWLQGGTFLGIRTAAQEQRAAAELQWWRDWGFGDEDFSWLDAASAARRMNMSGLRAATHTPHCARIQPLKLARGLAAAAERRGVSIFEGTDVTDFGTGAVWTSGGHTVRAPWIVRATEAYTEQLTRGARLIAPVYSLMVATPQLEEAVLADIGLEAGDTFADYRHFIIYGQRTADGRIAFGGRGAPYHFGSAIRPAFEEHGPTHAHIWRELLEVLPQLRGLTPTHRWGGPLAIPRDWMAQVGKEADGLASAGGYVGDGLGTSALGGRTLAELLTDRDSERTRLPWVGHRSRRWEPEPWRWLGVTAGLKTMAMADAEERLTGRPSVLAGVFNRLLRS